MEGLGLGRGLTADDEEGREGRDAAESHGGREGVRELRRRGWSVCAGGRRSLVRLASSRTQELSSRKDKKSNDWLAREKVNSDV